MEERLLAGNLWVFRHELDLAEKDFAPGSLVRVATERGRPLAVGLVNTQSTISVRLLARSGEFKEEEDVEFLLKTRLEQALKRRELLLPGLTHLRLVYSEGDCLPGLLVDRYGEALVMQVNTVGMEKHRDFLVAWLKEKTGCKVIVERSEGSAREKEGLKPRGGVAWKEEGFDESRLAHWQVSEAGWTFEADLLEGQKTGFFFDQRDTRRALGTLATGRTCLDAFCNTGAFSVALATGGAASVLGLDASETSLAMAKRNAELNKVGEKCGFEAGDVFVKLREWEKEGKKFGLILLDPPAFGKSKESLEGALRGYKEINYRALKMLEPGGLLVTCSCTQSVDPARFLTILQAAAKDAGCLAQVLYQGGQPADHPVLLGMPETRYLKAVIIQKN